MSAVAIPHDMDPHPDTGMYNGKFGIWLFLASEVMLFGALFSSYVLLRVGAPTGMWPHRGDEILNVWMAMINTFVLITSSVTMVMAWAALKMHDLAKGKMLLTITFLLAGTFLVVKFFEYKSKASHFEVFLNKPVMLHDHEVMSIRGHLEERSEERVIILPDAVKGHEAAAEAHEAPVTIEAANIKRLSNFGPWHSPFLAIYFTLTGLHGLHVIGGMVVIAYLIYSANAKWAKMPDKFTNRVECTGLYWHFVDLVWIFLFPVLYLL